MYQATLLGFCRDEREEISPSLALKSESWRLLTQPKPYSETSEWQAAERGVAGLGKE